MRKMIFVIAAILTVIGLGGCGLIREREEEAVQPLARLEIYEADGETLIDTVEEKEKLEEFQKAGWQQETEAAGTYEAEPDVQGQAVQGKEPLCSIAAFKAPAALLNNGKPEKIYTITLYKETNVIRMAAAPESIKNSSLPEEWLTFYFEIPEEDMEFLLSLAGKA